MLGILIPQKYIQKELQKKTKLVKDLDYDGIDFPVQENDFSKIEKNNNICINVFYYENRLTFPIYVLNKNLKTQLICYL